MHTHARLKAKNPLVQLPVGSTQVMFVTSWLFESQTHYLTIWGLESKHTCMSPLCTSLKLGMILWCNHTAPIFVLSQITCNTPRVRSCSSLYLCHSSPSIKSFKTTEKRKLMLFFTARQVNIAFCMCLCIVAEKTYCHSVVWIRNIHQTDWVRGHQMRHQQKEVY